jgi:hypothetical protein
MADESSILVIANVTATSPELVEALKARADRGPCRFTLVVPPKHDGGEDTARERLQESLERMRNAGLTVDGGELGEPDPVDAALKAWASEKFDEIVVSTLPEGTSKWLEADVPGRVESATSAPLTRVVAKGSGWETFGGPTGGE